MICHFFVKLGLFPIIQIPSAAARGRHILFYRCQQIDVDTDKFYKKTPDFMHNVAKKVISGTTAVLSFFPASL